MIRDTPKSVGGDAALNDLVKMISAKSSPSDGWAGVTVCTVNVVDSKNQVVVAPPTGNRFCRHELISVNKSNPPDHTSNFMKIKSMKTKVFLCVAVLLPGFQ